MKIILKGGNVYRGDRFTASDILIDGGRIVSIADNIDNISVDKVICCDSFFICPGFIDVHVHLREPGFSYKGTVKTETEAAAAGGYTAVLAMPNVVPAPSDLSSLEVMEQIIRKDAAIKVIPYGTITKEQSGRGSLSAMSEIAGRVASFSDDGKGVQEKELMRQAMIKAASLGKAITAHCEDEAYPAKDARSEWTEAVRDIQLAEETGAALHICHVSSAKTLEAVREAKARGVNVTCETAPHYIAFCEEDIADDGKFRMNPPIRADRDRRAIIEAVRNGTVDMIATDHAPHSLEEKSGGFQNSLNGIIGLETAFAVMNTLLCETGEITFEKLIQLMSTNPAARFNLDGGQLAEGGPADIVIIDRDAEWVIDKDRFKSKGRSCPFDGMKVKGQVAATICGGDIVYER